MTLNFEGFVECSNGHVRAEEDAFEDCIDNWHATKVDRLEAEVDIVTDILNKVVKFQTEYCTENTDYPNGYSHIINETRNNWRSLVKDWLESNYSYRDEALARILNEVCDKIDDFEAEPTYWGCEYSLYDGPDCCIFQDPLGEIEEQIDITCYDELHELHNEGRLAEVLSEVNCDAYVACRSYRSESKSPTFEIYFQPGGQWLWIVSSDRMHELVAEAIVFICERVDRARR